MLISEQLLRQLSAAHACQLEIRGWIIEHCERWLTPRRAAALEAAIVSTGFGFLLASWIFLLWTAAARG
jgi:hypothetical protein